MWPVYLSRLGGSCGAESARTTNGFGASIHHTRSSRVGPVFVASTADDRPNRIGLPTPIANTKMYDSSVEVMLRGSIADSPSDTAHTTPISSATTTSVTTGPQHRHAPGHRPGDAGSVVASATSPTLHPASSLPTTMSVGVSSVRLQRGQRAALPVAVDRLAR
jgi:hypothetical protein